MNDKTIFLLTLIAAIAFTIAPILYMLFEKNTALVVANAILAIVWWFITFKNFKKMKMSS
ncbi:MAG: hypothetical protein ACRCWM_10315 [Sarcina sp.]